MAFGLYGFSTSNRYYGYEGENAAFAEGLIKTGRFQIVADSPLAVYGHAGEDGRIYGRAGSAQPLLQAPFYSVGWALDGLRTAPPEYRNRDLALRFYNPFGAALAAAAMFAIVLLTRRSIPWAIAIAAAFTYYRPFVGKPVAFDLSDAERRFGMPVPDFGWTFGDFHGRAKAFAWLLAALFVGSATALLAAARQVWRARA